MIVMFQHLRDLISDLRFDVPRWVSGEGDFRREAPIYFAYSLAELLSAVDDGVARLVSISDRLPRAVLDTRAGHAVYMRLSGLSRRVYFAWKWASDRHLALCAAQRSS